ncbi:MAG TPA: hypothetical protein VK009_22435 [Chloroflexota bacterium]|nr:hypothetical protein [Chloroflexota bacterium]
MDLPVITDETMRARLAGVRTYTLMILKATPKLVRPDVDPIIWEHGRRNFALRETGLLNIVCPVSDGSSLCGIGIFDAEVERVREIMDDDPGVEAGIFTYELHPCRGFPGSASAAP